MKKSLVFSVLFWTMCQAQNPKYDFLDQVGLIKGLLPNIAKVGVMVGPKDYETLIESMGTAQSQFGIQVIPIKLNNVTQKLPQYVKTAATGVVKNHDINALLFVTGEDGVTKSQVGIKFTAGALTKSGVPVFSADEKGLELGCLGQFVLSGDRWIMDVSSATAGELNVTIPSGDPQFVAK